jgi:hypothetical protein
LECPLLPDSNQTGALLRNRKEAICFSPYLYPARNLVERLFNKIKQCRRVTTRYDRLAANYLAFIKLTPKACCLARSSPVLIASCRHTAANSIVTMRTPADTPCEANAMD